MAVYGESYPPQPSLLVKIKPKRSQDDSPASGDIFPYSMRGALYGVYHFPVDGEYEFRWRYSNLRGPEVPDQPPAAPGAEKGVRGGRGPLTPEQRKALDERNRVGAPPVQMVFAIDGKQALHGSGGRQHGLQLRARRDGGPRAADGGRSLSAERRFPSSRTSTIRGRNLNRDGRRKIFIDYLDIVGPYQPSAAPAGELSANFHMRPRARAITTRSARAAWWRIWRAGAYRRPATEQELQPLLKLAALAQKQGDPRGRRSAAQPAGDSDVAEFPVPHRTRSGGPAPAHIG